VDPAHVVVGDQARQAHLATDGLDLARALHDLGMEDLDGHRRFQAGVEGRIDGTHAPAAQDGFHAISSTAKPCAGRDRLGTSRHAERESGRGGLQGLARLEKILRARVRLQELPDLTLQNGVAPTSLLHGRLPGVRGMFEHEGQDLVHAAPVAVGRAVGAHPGSPAPEPGGTRAR
jgi:hypothetical protein